MAGDEIASSITSKTSGKVIKVDAKTISVASGESYILIASSKLMVEDGASVEAYDVLAKIEAIRRDPSKTKDIIQGLPKVEELFEARRPKDSAILSETAGDVSISDREGSRLLSVYGKDEKREYLVSYETRLKVTAGDKVHVGEQLTE